MNSEHPTSQAPHRSRLRKTWLILGIAAAAFVIVIAIIVVATIPFTSERARVAMIEQLSDRLDGEVELKELRLRILPRLRAEGAGLTVRHKGRRDVPPLISIERFAAEGGFFGLLRKRVAMVTLDGLVIEIPPDRNRNVADQMKAADSSSPSAPDTAETKEPARSPETDIDEPDMAKSFVIGELVSSDARLVILPRDPEKDPKVWQIHTLHMQSLAFDRAMPFQAQLTNAVPPGQIDVTGHFGPWGREDPGQTPLDGAFTFGRADLGVFKGISGILSSQGSFEGTLERIKVQGETDTPDFTVTTSGLSVPLHTKYEATVDGTNGDTLLERVEASFLKTTMVATGGVVHTPGRKKGRTITVDVVMDVGRIEDVLRLAVKSAKPPMIGALKLANKLVIPPGDEDVVKKLQLDGRFDIEAARFTDADVQRKINELSKRGSGKMEQATAARVVSDFSGSFKLANGRLTIPEVVFDVPGAAVELTGTYDLLPETIDFSGMLYMDAKISQTMTGFKSLLLKMVDPLFKKKGGGSAIPIQISGNRNNPSFGLDKGRVFNRD